MSCWDNITPGCAGWHIEPDLEWKTGPEHNLIQKSPTMPTSPCVPIQGTAIDAPTQLIQPKTAEKAAPIVPKKDRNST